MFKARRGTKDYTHEYWRQPAPSISNRPEAYIDFPARSEYLVQLINEHALVSRQAKILEIGTNVGRNLAKLFSEGFHNLTGIEISQPAIELMKTTYPEMYADSTIHNAAVEEIIESFGDNEFDLVYTMGVLMHIHRDSEWVFEHIARIAKLLIAIEAESGTSDNIRFPREYQPAFEQYGCMQLYVGQHASLPRCTIRIFDCRSVK